MDFNSSDIVARKELNKKSDNNQKKIFSGTFNPQFDPVFSHFLKSTELKGTVSSALANRFGDTYDVANITNKKNTKMFSSNYSNDNSISSENSNKKYDNSSFKNENHSIQKKENLYPLKSKRGKGVVVIKKGNINIGGDLKDPQVNGIKSNIISNTLLQSTDKINRITIISRISHIIQEKFSPNSTNSTHYKIDGGKFGNLELKLAQNNSNTQATLVVESEVIKLVMEKIVTEVKENLMERGIKLESFEVEVFTENDNSDNDKWIDKKVFNKIEEQNADMVIQSSVRDFGYNTIEILA